MAERREEMTCHMCWINYTDDGDGVDRRVTEWFAECWYDAHARWQDEVDAYFAEQRKAETEKAERAELARLKAKYDSERAETEAAE